MNFHRNHRWGVGGFLTVVPFKLQQPHSTASVTTRTSGSNRQLQEDAKCIMKSFVSRNVQQTLRWPNPGGWNAGGRVPHVGGMRNADFVPETSQMSMTKPCWDLVIRANRKGNQSRFLYVITYSVTCLPHTNKYCIGQSDLQFNLRHLIYYVYLRLHVCKT
jgi:hypothetical protein